MYKFVNEMKRKIVGWVCLILSGIGAILPIIPGILFFMLAVVLLKDSSTFVRWIWYQCQARIPKFKELSDSVMPKVDLWLNKLGL
ncbi:hypothetical protein [Candidatus Bodocaedibacter vickermanii]